MRTRSVSEHFKLRDFLTHDQANVWPKYLVLEMRNVDKLELVLSDLAVARHRRQRRARDERLSHAAVQQGRRQHGRPSRTEPPHVRRRGRHLHRQQRRRRDGRPQPRRSKSTSTTPRDSAGAWTEWRRHIPSSSGAQACIRPSPGTDLSYISIRGAIVPAGSDPEEDNERTSADTGRRHTTTGGQGPDRPARPGAASRTTEVIEIPDIRQSDLEPYVGLRYLSKLFKLMGVILGLLLDRGDRHGRHGAGQRGGADAARRSEPAHRAGRLAVGRRRSRDPAHRRRPRRARGANSPGAAVARAARSVGGAGDSRRAARSRSSERRGPSGSRVRYDRCLDERRNSQHTLSIEDFTPCSSPLRSSSSSCGPSASSSFTSAAVSFTSLLVIALIVIVYRLMTGQRVA